MNFRLRNLATAAALAVVASSASAVLIGSIQHEYGSDSGRQLSSIMGIYHPGGNCDVSNATSLTVKATSASACNRFADAFDFSSLNYESIDHFVMTVSFTGATNQTYALGFLRESWNLLGGYNYEVGGNSFGAISGTANNNGTLSFTFDNSRALFNNILGAKQFLLTFSTSGGTAMQFNLSSARLDVYGEPTATQNEVPEPTSLALAGLALAGLGLGAARRRKQQG